MKFTYAGVFLLALLSAAASYAADSVCDIALTTRAFDTESLRTSSSIAEAKRFDLCNKTYDSVSEAQQSAQSAGFDLSYAGVGIGANEASADANSKVSINSTHFCTASASDLKTSYSSNYEKQVAGVAVAAWEKCIETTNANRLYVEYHLAQDGRYFSGTIIRTVATGSLQGTITAISVAGDAAGVTCNIKGVPYEPGMLKTPVLIEETRTLVTCDKGATGIDKTVEIAFQTTADSVPFIQLPSQQTSEQIRFEGLQAEVEKLRTELAITKGDLVTASETLDGKIGATKGDLTSLTAAISHTAAVPPTEGTDFDIYGPRETFEASAACPEGTFATGMRVNVLRPHIVVAGGDNENKIRTFNHVWLTCGKIVLPP